MTGPRDQRSPVVLPPLHGTLNSLWDLILDIAEQMPPDRWALVGGQMVMLHGLSQGRSQTRASQDIDMLADLLTAPDGLIRCVNVVQGLDLTPEPDSSGRVYRFRRPSDRLVVDVLAPDHSPPRWSLRTARGGDTIQVPGGRQALSRAIVLTVSKDGRSAHVPVPDLLGALVLKAAAWATDSRDSERHSADAAFLASLVDPRLLRGRFAGSDRKRLNRLDKRLGDPNVQEWRSLGDQAGDAYSRWRLMLD